MRRWITVALLLLVPILAAYRVVKKGDNFKHRTTVIEFQVNDTAFTAPMRAAMCDQANSSQLVAASSNEGQCEWPVGHVTRFTEVSLFARLAFGATEICTIGLSLNGVNQAWASLTSNDVVSGCSSSRLTSGKITTINDYCTKTDGIGTLVDAGDVLSWNFTGDDCSVFTAGYFMLRGERVLN